MSQLFECAWESVRPVPRVPIDFGNGHALERTLHGNIVTYLCTSQGEVFDLIPGLIGAQEYVRRLDQAARLHRARSWGVLIPPLLPGASTFPGLGPGPDPVPSNPFAAPVPADLPRDDSWRETVLLWHGVLVERSRAGPPLTGDPISVFDGSKMRVERRIDMALAPPMTEADAASLEVDTSFNRTHRYPLASQLLLEHPFARPAEITEEVYRRVLGVDLADPYLGLAPQVLGGEGGRR